MDANDPMHGIWARGSDTGLSEHLGAKWATAEAEARLRLEQYRQAAQLRARQRAIHPGAPAPHEA